MSTKERQIHGGRGNDDRHPQPLHPRCRPLLGSKIILQVRDHPVHLRSDAVHCGQTGIIADYSEGGFGLIGLFEPDSPGQLIELGLGNFVEPGQGHRALPGPHHVRL